MWRFTFINVSLSSKFFFNLIRLAIYMKLECIKDLQMSKNDPNIEMFDEMICGKRVLRNKDIVLCERGFSY